MKEIKKWIGILGSRLNIVKMSIIPELSTCLMQILSKFQQGFFVAYR